MNRLVMQRRYWPLVLLVWALVVLVIFLWSKNEHDIKAQELAHERAHFVNRVVETTRTWAARHGGVYAPTTDDNPPNPWLPENKQQMRSESGVEFTLINPSYMTRQLGEVFSEFNEMNFRLVSIEPVNPSNIGDAWEQEQLLKFANEKTLHNAQDLQQEGEQPLFRYMTPLYLAESCMQCHTRTTDVLGSLRGAISVSFPAGKLFDDNREHLKTVVAFTHLGIWFLLSGVSLIGLSRLRKQILALQAAKANTEKLVVARTQELALRVKENQQIAAQLQLLIDSSGEGIIGLDLDGVCTLVNPAALKLLRMEKQSDLVGHLLHERIHYSDAHGEVHDAASCPMHGTITTGKEVHQEDDIFWRADGTSFPVEYRSHPLLSEDKLIGAVINFSDITERKNREQVIWRQAHKDALTGLANRTLMLARLKQILENSAGDSKQAAVLYVDLDGFKGVNDTLGHAAGDQVLISAASSLRSIVRENDLVARIGGDEFVVILDKISNAERVNEIAAEVVHKLGQPFETDAGVCSEVAASVGVALYPQHATDYQDLLAAADQAMYAAKQNGGNCWVMYTK